MAMDVIAEMMIQILFLLQPWNAMHLAPAIQIEFVVVHGDSQYMDLIDEEKICTKMPILNKRNKSFPYVLSFNQLKIFVPHCFP